MKIASALVLLSLLATASLMPFVAESQEPPKPCGAFYSIPWTDGLRADPVLVLPNSHPREMTVKLAPSLSVTKWLGLACDEVWLPAGSELRITAPESDFQRNSVWTLGPDGWLTWRFAPQGGN